MKTFDIKSSMLPLKEALEELQTVLKLTANEKIIKIIHGYGSTGVGGKIKKGVHQRLKELKSTHKIASFIPGEAFDSMLGFDEEIRKYRDLLRQDSDYLKANPGITYIIFK